MAVRVCDVWIVAVRCGGQSSVPFAIAYRFENQHSTRGAVG